MLPGVGEFRGSGVIIGPHTILTASHVLWDADSGVGASSAKITVGSTVIGGSISFHYNRVDDRDDELSRAGSAEDFAVINTTRDLSRFGSFDIAADFAGGRVNVSGYPANRGLAQVRTTGSVTASAVGSVLNYNGFSLSPGYSGRPLWVNQGTAADPVPAVAGVVSTTRWATQLTQADVRQIQRWEAADAGLWSDSPARAPVGTATAAGAVTAAKSLSSHVQASAAAFITGEGAVSPGNHAVDPWPAAVPHHAPDNGLFASFAGHGGPGSSGLIERSAHHG